MKELIYFIVTFLVTFSLSYFTVIRKATKKDSKNKKGKIIKLEKIISKIKKDKEKIKVKDILEDKNTGNENKIPVEIMYLINKYHLDLEKINYKDTVNLFDGISKEFHRKAVSLLRRGFGGLRCGCGDNVYFGRYYKADRGHDKQHACKYSRNNLRRSQGVVRGKDSLKHRRGDDGALPCEKGKGLR